MNKKASFAAAIFFVCSFAFSLKLHFIQIHYPQNTFENVQKNVLKIHQIIRVWGCSDCKELCINFEKIMFKKLCQKKTSSEQ